LLVEALDGRLRLGIRAHLDEAESLAPARLAVLDHLGALHGPELREQLLEIRLVDLIRQVAHIQFLTHC
jgi:hypothetical protein